MTKMQKWAVMLLATILMFLVSGLAHGLGLTTPTPGWQCYPFAGVAEYTNTETGCVGHAPVFAYLGDGQIALAYFMVSVKADSQLNCMESEAGWSPLEFGAQAIGGYGAATLQGEGLEFAAIPGAPADQGCLDSLRVPWPQVRVTKHRVDESFVLMTVEPMPAVKMQGKTGAVK